MQKHERDNDPVEKDGPQGTHVLRSNPDYTFNEPTKSPRLNRLSELELKKIKAEDTDPSSNSSIGTH
jgi:hypothetical protein